MSHDFVAASRACLRRAPRMSFSTTEKHSHVFHQRTGPNCAKVTCSLSRLLSSALASQLLFHSLEAFCLAVAFFSCFSLFFVYQQRVTQCPVYQPSVGVCPVWRKKSCFADSWWFGFTDLFLYNFFLKCWFDERIFMNQFLFVYCSKLYLFVYCT